MHARKEKFYSGYVQAYVLQMFVKVQHIIMNNDSKKRKHDSIQSYFLNCAKTLLWPTFWFMLNNLIIAYLQLQAFGQIWHGWFWSFRFILSRAAIITLREAKRDSYASICICMYLYVVNWGYQIKSRCRILFWEKRCYAYQCANPILFEKIFMVKL